MIDAQVSQKLLLCEVPIDLFAMVWQLMALNVKVCCSNLLVLGASVIDWRAQSLRLQQGSSYRAAPSLTRRYAAAWKQFCFCYPALGMLGRTAQLLRCLVCFCYYRMHAVCPFCVRLL